MSAVSLALMCNVCILHKCILYNMNFNFINTYNLEAESIAERRLSIMWSYFRQNRTLCKVDFSVHAKFHLICAGVGGAWDPQPPKLSRFYQFWNANSLPDMSDCVVTGWHMVQAGDGSGDGIRQRGWRRDRPAAAAAAAGGGGARPRVVRASSDVRRVRRSHDRPAHAQLPRNGDDAALFAVSRLSYNASGQGLNRGGDPTGSQIRHLLFGIHYL